MKTIEIKSTFKGMCPDLFEFLLWVIIPTIATIIINHWWGSFRLNNGDYNDLLVIAVPMLSIIIGAFVLGIGWNILTTAVYSPTKIITLHLNDKDEVIKIVETYKKFINKQYRNEVVCDRILSMEVYIPTLGPIFNTGTLTIKSVVFTNADYKKETFVIEGVEFPEKTKDKIMQTSPGHEGLKVVL